MSIINFRGACRLHFVSLFKQDVISNSIYELFRRSLWSNDLMISESAWSKCLSLTSLWQQTSLGISTRPPLTHSWTTLIHSTEFPPSGEVGIKNACKHTDKSHECILLVHANPPCSCCFLSYLCVFSSLCHALFLCAQSIFKTLF